MPVPAGERHIQDYFNNKRGRKRKLINSQQEKARHEERIKQRNLIVQAKLIVGYLELIPKESGGELSATQDTAVVRVAEERPEANK